ncbi:mannitol dehydrogenase family protein [Pengzhenrongella sicca]|uniref:Mannitol-1-phosphate 5-dehydrogenase n=1 Tax=Pengzhenrongella sicca TaxID=2819238 RepID=A0A8A4ZEL8_9MICO|nr:mannitol dehydrogenase family protein [Pengzhenrongella sicca]QTE28937.1 mannitol dehydrogenase family protein [Pengzhenrongella sicca]
MATRPVAELRRLGEGLHLSEGVTLPRAIPEGVGIVHLGWGAFHRGHQAVYTEDAMAATGDLRWGILGDVERTPQLVDAVRPQGGWYTVLSVGLDAEGNVVESARVVGSVVDVAYPGKETPRLLGAMTAPTTHLITLTVTEKGYTRRPDGHLDTDQADPDIRALAAEESAGSGDVSAASPAATAVGLLVRGLAARRRAGGYPLTVLSCDNMPDNGKVLKAVVDEFLDVALPGAAGELLRNWLSGSVTFPGSMVDRITPATTPEVLDKVAGVIGARDEGAIIAEPFTQWVIEDNFAGPRPAWELVGAELTDDVVPWEDAKLRLLNGTHSLLAYAGRLAGHTTLAEAVTDPAIAEHARAFMFDDALPTLAAPDGADLRAYGDELMRRFANPATGHTTRQVSTDGTQKIPFRWGVAATWNLERGRVPQGVAYGLAAWSEFVRRAVRDGAELGDPAGAERLSSVVREVGLDDIPGVATALVALPGVLPAGAGTHTGLVAAVVGHAVALAVTDLGLD